MRLSSHRERMLDWVYLRQIVESAPVEQVLSEPLHPYPRTLQSSALPIDRDTATVEEIEIVAEAPSLSDLPKGCAFHTRCPKVMDISQVDRPALGRIRRRAASPPPTCTTRAPDRWSSQYRFREVTDGRG